MIEVTVFLGKSIETGTEWDSFSFPAVPNVGDVVRQPDGPTHVVKEVEFFLGPDRTAGVRIAMDSKRVPSKYDLNAMVG